MTKDKHSSKSVQGNPPGTGKAGKGPGNSVNKGVGTGSGYGRKGPAKNPPMYTGPGNKGGKPPRT